MEPILCGLETEYGLFVNGKGAEDQIELSKALVRSYPDECFLGWDYSSESPRADLRGFQVEKLQIDPEDAKFDKGKPKSSDSKLRSDRVLNNGARLYNDHGHPEFATPECTSAFACAVLDRAGEHAVRRAATRFEETTGLNASLYKNNTDFHGATYGCHESYLVPRSVGWDSLVEAVLPMLVVRQILTGAGKVGSEGGSDCRFQLSQRADFCETILSADTLFKRPIFNTRDEPHADPNQWMRLHVICGDANMNLATTARKLALTKLAIQLAIARRAPKWSLKTPVAAIQSVSRDESRKFQIELADDSFTTAYEILESYFEAAERQGWLKIMASIDSNVGGDPYLIPFTELQVIPECRVLLEMVREFDPKLKRHVDWAAKLAMLESFVEQTDGKWNGTQLRSFDLEYHNIDPNEGLYSALIESGEVDDTLMSNESASKVLNFFPTQCRSEIRSYALHHFREFIESCNWRTITFLVGEKKICVDLPPNWHGTVVGRDFSSVESIIDWIRGLNGN